MSTFKLLLRAAPAALFAVALLASVNSAKADIKDYEIQFIDKEVKRSNSAIVSIRVIHKKTEKPVSGVVIFSKRLDMAPENMAAHVTSIEPLPETDPGIYRFKADLSMEGRWQLSIAVKVQGETGTLQARQVIKVLP